MSDESEYSIKPLSPTTWIDFQSLFESRGAPKPTFKTLTGTLDTGEEKVWSIVCFYVKKADQGKGVQRRLLHAAYQFAAENGATSIEAYPVERTSPSFRFMGFIDLFEEEGFSYLGDAGTRRKIYRKNLALG